MEMSKEQQEKLEQLIDSDSFAGVLEAMELICLRKAKHLRENWQDERTAKVWELLARHVAKVSDTAMERGV